MDQLTSTSDTGSAPPWRRRSLLAALGAAPLAGGMLAATATAASAAAAPDQPGGDPIPPDSRPGGAYDRYVAGLAAEARFSGVVLLSHRGRTVLSRSYGMADQEKGIRNHQGTA
jgi:CubicO group peptidase (beta-lactamase class C family)